METKNRLRIHSYIFVLHYHRPQFETGRCYNIQVLEYRKTLQALRVLILQVSFFFRLSKEDVISDLQEIFTPLHTLTKQAVRIYRALGVAVIKRINYFIYMLLNSKRIPIQKATDTPFKRRQLIRAIAQRAADYGVFGHNFGQITSYIAWIWHHMAAFKALLAHLSLYNKSKGRKA